MSNYARHVGIRTTPQSEPIPGRTDQVENSAGGFGFAVDRWTRLERFLVLGNEGGTYYATEKALTLENAGCVRECLTENPTRTIATIVQISEAGRAPKNDPAIFALALAASCHASRLVLEVMPRVCRTGTHLFQFVEAVKQFRGWGKGLRKIVAHWYETKNVEQIGYQVTKYAQRGGWSHRDVLRKCGPREVTEQHGALYRWIAQGMEGMGERYVKRGEVVTVYPGHDPALLPQMVHAFEMVKAATSRAEVIRLIRDYAIPREFLEGPQSEYLNHADVWEALLEQMPLTAMVRNLGKMSALGLLAPLAAFVTTVADRLTNGDYIRQSRLHPLAILLALKTYASGHGFKGKLSWTPVSQVNDALDTAFYLAFGNVVPAGKRTLMALDVSGSMGSAISGTSLTCAEGAAALAMVQAKTEPQYQLMAFADTFRSLDVARCSRLADVVKLTNRHVFGGTDCSLPMLTALQNGWPVDTFQVYTDNETWAGQIHPCQALVKYRQKTGIPARLVVVGMTSSGFTIADPEDAGMMDVVGFDVATPGLISDFSRG